MLVDLDANMAIALAPHLKQVQLNAMTNGNNYIPILPEPSIVHTSAMVMTPQK